MKLESYRKLIKDILWVVYRSMSGAYGFKVNAKVLKAPSEKEGLWLSQPRKLSEAGGDYSFTFWYFQ